jgi:hypothetical protein
MQLRELVERQFGFPIRQGKANNNILAAHLPPKSFRRPFLRLRSAQALNPDKVAVCHVERPKQARLYGQSPRLRWQTIPDLWPGKGSTRKLLFGSEVRPFPESRVMHPATALIPAYGRLPKCLHRSRETLCWSLLAGFTRNQSNGKAAGGSLSD